MQNCVYIQSFSSRAPLDTMVFTMKHLFVCVVLYVSTCFASNEIEVPSKITVKENFNNPAILNPVSPYGPPPIVSNFVHQGTNFFFNPQFLLGTNIPPPLGAVVAAIPNPPNVEVIVNKTVISPELPPVIPVEKPLEVITPPPPPTLIPVIPEVTEAPVPLPEIPPAPVLPPLVLPKIPVWVEESVQVVPACEEKDVFLGVSKVKFINEESLQIIPRSPVDEVNFKINKIPKTIKSSDIEDLFSMDEDKTVILVPSSRDVPMIEFPRPINDALLIENNKVLRLPTPIPTDCAHNIVLGRILPNMISKKTVTKSLEIMSIPAVQYPVIAQRLIPACN